MGSRSTLLEIQKTARALANPKKALVLQRFFKTGKGEYGEGDLFLGLMNPQVRALAKEFRELPIASVKKLLRSSYNEERLLALCILDFQFKKGDEKKKILIYRLYLKSTKYINNWNLVDCSAPNIVGVHLFEKDRSILYRLAKSKDLWERRIAIVTTIYFIRNRDFDDALRISVLLLGDQHDLIHKACGWMLREVGKKDVKVLEKFLDRYRAKMPRTMLRYAIERFPEAQRKAYLKR